MALLAGFNRNDPKYLEELEQEFARLKAREDVKPPAGAVGGVAPVEVDLSSVHNSLDNVTKSLDAITDRLSKLESHKHDDGDHGDKGGKGMSPASLISSPLTKVLARLTEEDDDLGINLRPETYAQSELKAKARDHNKMDTLDLFYGWVCVTEYLMRTGGDLTSYIGHLKFATEMLHTRKFFDCGAIKYDWMIIDKHIGGKSGGFNPDTVLSSLTFSSRVIPESIEICHGGSLTKGVMSTQLGKQTCRRRTTNAPRKLDEVPPDFPNDVCFFYNYRFCL